MTIFLGIVITVKNTKKALTILTMEENIPLGIGLLQSFILDFPGECSDDLMRQVLAAL